MSPDPTAVILAQLAGSSGDALAELLVDHLLAQAPNRLIDTAALASLIASALVGPGAGLLLAEHLPAVIALETDHALGRAETQPAETLGDYLPHHVLDELLARATRPTPLPAGWADAIISPRFLRALIADALADTLDDFLKSLPLAGAASSLLSSFTRRAARVDASAVPFGTQAQAFAQSAAGRFQRRFLARLKAPDSAPELDAMRQRACAALLGLPTASLLATAEDPGPETLARWAQEILHQSANRPDFVARLAEQLCAAVDRATQQDASLGALLERASLRDATRALAIASARQHLGRLVASPAFEQWLQTLLAAPAS